MLMGILYAGALYKAMREGRGESREMWEYEGRCVRVVRRRLETEEEGKGGDEGIGAVTCLALGEVSTLFSSERDGWDGDRVLVMRG